MADPVVEEPTDVVVQVIATTICGTDLHILKGDVPDVRPGTVHGQCRNGGGWVLGHLINGTQAEYVRVPYADLSGYPLPSGLDSAEAVLLSDIFPSTWLNRDWTPRAASARTRWCEPASSRSH